MFAFSIISWLCWINIFHDACHFSISSNNNINKIISYLHIDFVTPLVWFYQHNISHHSYTNLIRDVDLFHASKILRVSNYTKYNIFHKFQHRINYILVFSNVFMKTFISQLYRKIFKKKYFKIIEIDNLYSFRELNETIISIIFLFIRFYIFSYYISIYKLIIPIFIVSLLFTFNTQITHLHENTFHNEKDWYIHQVLTSSNHSIPKKFSYFKSSILVYLFSGGLNYQIEHHLFPGVNHCHYPYIQPIVEKICKKYNITYKKFNGYHDAFSSYYKHIRDLSYEKKEK